MRCCRTARRRADLSSLRTFVTTGEPWNPEPYRWLFEDVGGSRVPVINCTGGTEVGACFLSPTPVGPIKACSVGGPALGMAMDVVDDTGASLVGTGEVGELVCRKPFPGMTRGFWRDPDKFIETYWSRIPDVWVHGDWASVDADGYWFLHGRSDDTLNIAGKRIGPAELESAAVGHPAVREAAAIGVPHEVKGETAWIFACLLPGAETTEADVAAHVAAELGKAFKPDRVFFVDALPKTRSAKIVRRAVKATALGADPGDLSSLENPESLDVIEAAVALRASQWSPAAGAGSARTSRARSRATAGTVVVTARSRDEIDAVAAEIGGARSSSMSPSASAVERVVRRDRRRRPARRERRATRAARMGAADSTTSGDLRGERARRPSLLRGGARACRRVAHRDHRQRRGVPARQSTTAYSASKAAVCRYARDAEQRSSSHPRLRSSAPGSCRPR